MFSLVQRLLCPFRTSSKVNCSSSPLWPSRLFSTAKKENPNSKPKTGIVLMNMGGPEDPGAVKTFLNRLFSDKDIIPLPFQHITGPAIANIRTPRIQKLYEAIGGSPIKKWTTKQGEQMIHRLDEVSPGTAPHKFYIAFRYVHPLTEETLMEMKKDGIKRAVAFTQYPQFSCTTTGSSLNELWKTVKRLNFTDEFKWSIIDRWPTHEGFINAVSERVKEGIESFPEHLRKEVVILFSAHSLPMRIVERGDPYPQEVATTVHRVMEGLHFSHKYLLTWQSAVGPTTWLGPQTVKIVEQFGKKGHHTILVVPIAFTSDHVETLSEIDIEMKHAAQKAGVTHFKRAPSLNDSRTFTNAMADIVAKHLHSKTNHSPQYKLKCPGCSHDHCRLIINPAEQPHH